MKKIIVIVFILLSIKTYAGYFIPYPAKTAGLNVPHIAFQSIFKSTYGIVNTQQEHFIIFFQYGFRENIDIGITANYHIIDKYTPIGKEKIHGMGDPSIYVRWYIFGNKWIDLGLKCDLNVPIGNNYFGTEIPTHNSIFISEFNLIYIRPYISFGHYTTDAKNGYFRFNFGIQKRIVKAWTPFVGVYTEVYQKGYKEVPCYTVIGSILEFKEHMFRIEYIINTKNFKSEKAFFALRYMYNFKK
jgi:hypothetical protein